ASPLRLVRWETFLRARDENNTSPPWRRALSSLHTRTMKTLLLILLLAAPVHAESSFAEVWQQVASDPYTRLPHDRVTLASFYGGFHDYLQDASKRTLWSKADLLPRFDKLVHPNGVCLAGTWSITADTPWSGYFKKGSHALIIVRASDALGQSERGHYRAF